MLEMVVVSDSTEAAGKVFDFETSMASKFMTKTDLRDPEATYNIVAISDLQKKCPPIDWTSYLALAHNVDASAVPDTVGKISLATVEALENTGTVISSADLPTVKAYLKWKAVR